MNVNMKTITLDDEVYHRLKAWKRAKGDSFSTVVKRVVAAAAIEAGRPLLSRNRRHFDKIGGLELVVLDGL